MSKLQSVPSTDGLIAKSDVINGMWGIAKALENDLLEPRQDEDVAAYLAIALVNLSSQLKECL